jgi:hypothetical protein
MRTYIALSDLHRSRMRLVSRCVALALGVGVGAVDAAPLFVTSCADDNGAGTLRSVVGSATAGAVIDAFSQSSCSKITLMQGEIVVAADNVTIEGPSSGTLMLDGNHNGRIFDTVHSLHLSHLYLTGGSSPTGQGGGCIAADTVYLDASVVSGCSASFHSGTHGGGIAVATAVHLTDSVVSNNAVYATDAGAAPTGGAIATRDFFCTSSTVSGNKSVATFGRAAGIDTVGDVTITGCTIDSNTSNYYAAMWASNSHSTITITNSTFSGNHAANAQGAFFVAGALTMRNSTVAFNTSNYCGGMRAYGTVTIESSIIANNLSNASTCVDLRTAMTISGGNNLVSVVNTPVPADTIVANPRLTALADHGGLTRTHGLSLGSMAIDHGSNFTALADDQRGAGFARDVGGQPDIGAFERQAGDDEIFYGGFQ